MKIEVTQDINTGRIERLDLKAQSFQEERALTFLYQAIQSGREIAVELPDDEELVFWIET